MTKISPIIKSYEQALQLRISAARHRADEHQKASDWLAAHLEITRADALKTALELYIAWSL